MQQQRTLKSWYDHLTTRRAKALVRAEKAAQLTDPSLFYTQAEDPDQAPDTFGYQSLGAQGVNEVANRIVMSLFRPSRPFFRLSPSKKGLQAFREENPGAPVSELEVLCADAEKAALAEWEARGQRETLTSIMEQLVVAGNVVVLRDEDTKLFRIVSLNDFVVQRSVSGRILRLIVKDTATLAELPPDVQGRVAEQWKFRDNSAAVSVYTAWVYSHTAAGTDFYTYQQSADDVIVVSDDKPIPSDKLPWFLATWRRPPKATYATSLVYQHLADLAAYQAISEAMVNGGILASDWRWLVDPAGMTQIDDLNESERGDAIPGRVNDVAVTSMGDATSVQVLERLADRYERRLGRAFLMNSMVTRDSERTTATEIRAQAQELERAYSGVYSSLAKQVQLPLARWLLSDVGVDVDDSLELKVITGLEVLSRGADLEDFIGFLTTLTNAATLPPMVLERLVWAEVIRRVGLGTHIDTDGLIKSDEELAQERQQAQQEALAMAEAQASIQQGQQPSE